jgi:hypothetical protein
MKELRVTLVPFPRGATICATVDRRRILTARLPMPWHACAVPRLLEALGLWHPLPIRAALVVDARSSTFATRLYPGWFPDFGTDAYALEVVDRPEAER